MAHSLGLKLYTMSAGAPATPAPARAARPEGPLVWLHGPTPDARRVLAALVPRLMAGGAVSVLATGDAPPEDARRPRGMVHDLPPHDSPAEVRAFLDHWSPSAALLTEGELRPLLVHEAQERGIPLIMAEARAPHLPGDRTGWWPGLVRGLLSGFHAVLAVDEPAARAFRKAGGIPARVEAAGRMEQPSAALSCTEAERAAQSRLLGTRPVWLAVAVPQAEEGIVIEAHRAALRLTHRLLLILLPEDADRAQPLADRMEAVEGWTVARRFAEEEPDGDVQVLITDSAAELGLWLRLAPVTYIGGSLTPGGARVDPMVAAALGSAILHGPRAGVHGGSVGRLAAGQASALVGSGADLAETLGDLLAPDRAARLAQAAWSVASEGAEVTERVADLLRGLALGRA
ncbi:MAG: 3-deoxy-D-manno-octulosonic acid transferase [Gemmobacter sp.]